MTPETVVAPAAPVATPAEATAAPASVPPSATYPPKRGRKTGAAVDTFTLNLHATIPAAIGLDGETSVANLRKLVASIRQVKDDARLVFAPDHIRIIG